MRVTTKSDGDNLLRNIAGRLAANQRKPHIIVAKDEPNLKDDAKQSAEAYWFMGWTWDEIESVLEDSEYPADVISYAMKSTKEHARKVLNEGPFAMLNAGQTVKLANGSIGRLIDVHSDNITVDLPEIGPTKVTAAQLNVPATIKLREAYALRGKSAGMLAKVFTDALGMACKAHTQTAESTPELHAMLSTITALSMQLSEIKKEATILHDNWDVKDGKWEAKSPEEQEFVQYMHVTLQGEQQLDQEATALFYDKLGSAATDLYNTLQETQGELTPDTQSFVTESFPQIVQSIEAHLYTVGARTHRAKEYIHQFDEFDNPEKQAEAVNWAKGSWDTTKKYIHKWENAVRGNIEEGITRLENLTQQLTNQKLSAKVREAIKQL